MLTLPAYYLGVSLRADRIGKLQLFQDNVLVDLVDRLRQRQEQFETANFRRGSSRSVHHEISNVFGLLGPRGAGKSTVLYEFSRRTTDPSSQVFEALSLPEPIKILPPLDCSVVPAKIEPGLAILLHLRRILRDSLEPRETDTRYTASKATGLKKCLECMDDELLPTYMRMNELYKELRLQLTSSTKKFSKELVEDITDRSRLPEKLAAFLANLGKNWDFGTLVVLLDDFDLVQAWSVRNWLHSLLDEMHQAQLFFVLTADFYRLQHLAYDPVTEIDDKTGRNLLNKILPWQNRLNLDPWPIEKRREFVHFRSSDTPKSSEESPKLIELVQNLFHEKFALSHRLTPLVSRLLPKWPRGLANLYDSLETWKKEPWWQEEMNSRQRVERLRSFLALLATGRSEHLLARRIEESPLAGWEEILEVTKSDLLPEEWVEVVEAVTRRARSEEEAVEPIRGLDVPVVLHPGGHLSGSSTTHKTGNTDEGSDRETQPQRARSRFFILYDPALHDPSSHDPLRHEELWQHPLRDADEEARPLWCELLLNLSFLEDIVENPNRAARNRLSFLSTWRPASSRQSKAYLQVDSSAATSRNLLTDYEDLNLKPLLFWWSWEIEKDDQLTSELGWVPLLQALRGDREPLATEKVLDLKLDPRELRGQIPPPEASQALGLIPDQLWAIILLVDALDRCPWKAFSARLGWTLPTYLLTAGALVHGAYLQAMDAGGLLEGVSLREEQQHLLTSIRQSDPTYILSGAPDAGGAYAKEDSYEENIFKRLARILASDLPTGDDPLGRAAKAFQDLAPYQALRDLAEEGLLL